MVGSKHRTLDYRVWAYCEPRGWNVTYAEVADALGVNPNTIIRSARRNNWVIRFRTTSECGFGFRDLPHAGRISDPRNYGWD